MPTFTILQILFYPNGTHKVLSTALSSPSEVNSKKPKVQMTHAVVIDEIRFQTQAKQNKKMPQILEENEIHSC